MAQTTSKKNTTSKAGKTASTNTKSKAKKAKNNKKPLEKRVNRIEISATCLFVVGLVLLILVVFAGSVGTWWNTLHMAYLAVFGVTAFYLPAVNLFFGITVLLNKNKPVFLSKAIEAFVFLWLVCAFLHINGFAVNHTQLGYAESIQAVYDGVVDFSMSTLRGGGVLGAVLGGALYQLGKSRILADVLIALFMIADVMLMFGVTLTKLLTGIEKPAKKVGQYTGDALENAKSDISRLVSETSKKAEAKSFRKADIGQIVGEYDEPDATDLPIEKKVKSTHKEKATGGQLTLHTLFDAPVDEEKSQNVSVTPDAHEQNSVFDYPGLKGFTKAEPTMQDNVKSADEDFIFEQVKQEETKKAETERLDPLSKEEANALNEELNEALNQPEEKEYVLPPLDCLKMPTGNNKNYDPQELKNNGDKLITALNSFNVSASIVDVVPGPTVTRYELSPAPGVKISKFVGLSDDLALHLAAPAGLRIEAPIPNKAAIGIEIPNRNKTTVTFREVIDNDTFKNSGKKLNVALGKDISGDVIYCDIAKMPHLLVAGTTGSGKSVCLNTMIMSILYNATPDEVKIILIDPKQVEFGIYNGLPHLLVPVVSDPRKASGALGWAVTEMLNRYKTLNANGVRDIGAYNSLCEERDDLVKMSQIVIFIDELSDLMTVAPAEVEDSIQRLAQMARAAGMHLVVATQRPSVDVITGVIKANIPSRIALTVKSQIDSRTIIDQAGAEKLMGYGDMLYYPVGLPKPIRVQGAYLSDSEIENVVTFIRGNGMATYDDAVQQEIERQAAQEKKKNTTEVSAPAKGGKEDDLIVRAIELFINTPEKASISAMQRHLGLGFAKAGRLMDTLEERGFVGPAEGSKPRKLLITKAQFYEMCAMSSEVNDVNAVAQAVQEAEPMVQNLSGDTINE